jgi:hypothetical protein
MIVFWDVTLYSLVPIHYLFRGACFVHLHDILTILPCGWIKKKSKAIRVTGLGGL